MLIGYARTSTAEQQAGFEVQVKELQRVGVEKLFKEQVSSVARTRDQLAAALDYCRDGDTLVVTKLDRLARSVAHLVEITKTLEGKGAHLRVLGLNLDTNTPTGRLMLNMLASVAQFEREIMLERQREGIAKAKRAGRYRGRAPTARAKSAEVVAMSREKVRPVDIARRLGIGRASVYRILAAEQATEASA